MRAESYGYSTAPKSFPREFGLVTRAEALQSSTGSGLLGEPSYGQDVCGSGGWSGRRVTWKAR